MLQNRGGLDNEFSRTDVTDRRTFGVMEKKVVFDLNKNNSPRIIESLSGQANR